jgi:hypothetical protein
VSRPRSSVASKCSCAEEAGPRTTSPPIFLSRRFREARVCMLAIQWHRVPRLASSRGVVKCTFCMQYMMPAHTP